MEIKGYRGEDAKDKKETMETKWVPGVNHFGTFGRWAFAEFNIPYSMKNITLSADEELIESARARRERTTLNEQFRRWLADYARQEQRAGEAVAVIRKLQGYVRTGGRTFTRDEMNER